MQRYTAYIATTLMSATLVLVAYTMRPRRHENDLFPIRGVSGSHEVMPLVAQTNRSTDAPIEIEHLGDRKLPGSTQQLSVANLATEYRERRDSVNFDEKAFLSSILNGGIFFGKAVELLRDTNRLLEMIPVEDHYYITKPAILLERMAVVDMMKAIHDQELDFASQQKARGVLRDVIEMSIPRDLPEHIKKILASEKYDAMQLLAQLSPDEAMSAYDRVSNERMRSILRSAIDEGLSRSTLSESELSNIRQRLRL